MLGRNRIKLIKSLEHKKFRNQERLFVAEGDKLVKSLLESGTEVVFLAGTPGFLGEVEPLLSRAGEWTESDEAEIAKASLLKNPQHSLALCRIPSFILEEDVAAVNPVIVLDDIQDPGNLGTIVRLACWFGITDIVCSPGTADIYNPKAVQATMGAISSVRVHYTSLQGFLKSQEERNIPTMGTFMDGENIYSAALPCHGVILLGNEGNGIGRELLPFISLKIAIPDFSAGRRVVDSLNVSTAAAIVLSEIRRRK